MYPNASALATRHLLWNVLGLWGVLRKRQGGLALYRCSHVVEDPHPVYFDLGRVEEVLPRPPREEEDLRPFIGCRDTTSDKCLSEEF
jgi:hypothetical protein